MAIYSVFKDCPDRLAGETPAPKGRIKLVGDLVVPSVFVGPQFDKTNWQFCIRFAHNPDSNMARGGQIILKARKSLSPTNSAPQILPDTAISIKPKEEPKVVRLDRTQAKPIRADLCRKPHAPK
jgi:hypothetical protein